MKQFVAIELTGEMADWYNYIRSAGCASMAIIKSVHKYTAFSSPLRDRQIVVQRARVKSM